MESKKYVYYFGGGKSDGNRQMKLLLGGKGANLAEMVNLGIPVPPGFTITTEVCSIYQATKGVPQEVVEQVKQNVRRVEEEMGMKFGSAENPLLFSVRSGAAASMPGMMDTVLNLGLNKATVEAWIRRAPQLERFVYDAYRRFITMYADIVMQVGREDFEEAIGHMKERKGTKFDTDLTARDLKQLCDDYLVLYQRKTGCPFPQDPMTQLFAAINAVFRSWGNPRAVIYRRMNNITGLLGTAVNVQAMVFGNINDRSATGVAFSRSPSTGENFFFGEYLVNAQGEDVVAGIRTPQQISYELSLRWAKNHGVSEEERRRRYPSMEETMPENYRLLCDIRKKLENHYRDMQDIEFTVQDGRLWMLQCRNGKRTIHAAVRIAIEMVKEGLISKEEAVLRIDPSQVDHLMHPNLDPSSVKGVKPIGKGLAASPGAAVGQIVFDAESARQWNAKGKKVIMVRLETSPEDLAGMDAACGILTARGGMTSHAAVVARGMGKCCVSGCGDMVLKGKQFTLNGQTFREGDYITIDGTRGLIYAGKLKLQSPNLKGSFETILQWCREAKRLGVRANADTPNDAAKARGFGAEGVGLCRTEHMFFEGTRIDAIREMILADNLEGRKNALQKLLPLQRDDFVGIFKAMKGLPVTIRLLDPPLHEFVPHDDTTQSELAEKLGVPVEKIRNRVKSLFEANPMLGHRGCRLGITYPEIYNMQVQAIIEAAIAVTKEGSEVVPEIMIPLVGKKEELGFTKAQAVKTAEATIAAAGQRVHYIVGTMIEVPRAAVTADKVAEEADFFSFGTNDLTQMGCGFSRDDSGPFLRHYGNIGIYDQDPFQSLDQEGVGELVRIAVRKGRSVKPMLKMGICGEHGGDPLTIAFCHKVGLNYVSCSPFRVPVAIVAAAHAAIKEKRRMEEQYKAIAAKL
ncbi:Pyruvate phosphate dikinase PEP pyruvate binding domain [Trypanosoma vivax]|uniref:Pyruvate, phosphate dikinase n=1 Tax=Trypanosoma vivax (strain Y486) TaxID=1055687 RepID=G0UBI5_TRYVY|nr:pyruvate phosphate dikinase [Trypanosoma vivax]KAH8613139.1 Pyruvate phosphate dikinase PEP pyruvate binding domain [Trypanosoma vivax]CCC53181.1 putative pyruvate phosphate dikinase [Trypanosoma vivax Y486]